MKRNLEFGFNVMTRRTRDH